MTSRALVLCSLVLAACGAEHGVEPAPIGPDGGASDQVRSSLIGDITWQVTFDDTAKAAGATDCSYTRRYVGHEDRSVPWLCPACEQIFRAEVEVVAGLSDCYPQVSLQDPLAEEWLGYGDGGWWRGGGGPMTDQGTVAIDGASVATSHSVTDLEAPAGGTLAFAVTGALTLGEEPGDPLNGFAPPASYTCGWPRANRPPYTGDYVLTLGAPIPDGLFRDACDEPVRLHDLAGAYLLITMSSTDCPPCQLMAQEEEAFIGRMRDQGVDVAVVTLLAPSLGDPLGVTTPAIIQGWVANFGLSSPVLADRAYGLSMFLPAIGEDTGYPSNALVAPDLTVLFFETGFANFSVYENAILTHAQ